MNRNISLAHRLREVLLNGYWVANTNIKDQIESLVWSQATQKIGDLNTIAVLTYHINYYLKGIINVFKGGELEIRDTFSFNLPPITSQTDWERLIIDFVNNAETFVAYVEKMKDSKFDEPFINEKYGTYQRNIEGVIEHSYYHLGQISLIKKMIVSL